MESTLSHYGTPRHSGRYPWGSGDDPQQHSKSFNGYVSDLKKKGFSEVDIAKGLGMTTNELRNKVSLAKMDERKENIAQAIKLKEKGLSNTEIGRLMNKNESSIRSLLDPTLQARAKVTNVTADILRDNVISKGYIDVGPGVENYMGISRTRLKTAISLLKEEGYTTHNILVNQMAGSSANKTTIAVLAQPGITISDVYKNKDKISLVSGYSDDGGITFNEIKPPKSISSKRIQVRYNEDGGVNKDGVIELRRGIDDISLGKSRYAQVRIAVDDTHYLKGMAMYSDNMPDGVDIVFNTNKHKGTPVTGSKDNTVLKLMKDDPENPFGAVVRQREYIGKDGKKHQSVVNICKEEGEWKEWSKDISTQMLAKQNLSLAKKQLDLTYDIKRENFDEIMSLTNPAVKKSLLLSFADDCDSSAVHLKAAGLPGQAYHVILPFPKMKEDEIYAPNYNDGDMVALIRFPHGGKFEIPQLRVNNKQKDANSLIHNAPDAVGINHKVAERLSGADFDGDTVLVIPNNKGLIKSSSPLKGLENFDPKESYPAAPGMKIMGTKGGGLTGQKMGDITNLITDMQIKGANADEICRAVRHSMVVIDAEKHKLNYTKSYVDNGIAELKQKYQGGANRGASTLVSKASSEARVNARKDGVKVINPETGKSTRFYIDPVTGKKLYTETNESYVDKNGKTIKATITSTKMAEVEDAYSLSSGTPIENLYAEHANNLKALGNQARKEYLKSESIIYSPSANKTYANEVSSLNAQLNIALKNAPLERQAQLLANSMLKAQMSDNPGMENSEIKKLKGKDLILARNRTGASKQRVDISDKEWEAIQSGAISNSKLEKIIANTDPDKLKQLAMPRTTKTLTPAKVAKGKAMLKSGCSQAEIAQALSVSVSTVYENL